MSSGRQKRIKLKQRRREKRAAAARVEVLPIPDAVRAGTALPVDKTKVRSRCAIPKIPDYYRDIEFTCRDCDKKEVWTARMQKRWYEEQGGEIETTAIRCHACRKQRKERAAKVREAHFEGLKKAGKLHLVANSKHLNAEKDSSTD